MPKFAISILTYSALTHAKRCIDSVLKNSNYSDYRLILTANGNNEVADYFHSLAAQNKNITCISNSVNLGFIEPNRQAFNLAEDCQFFVMLNDDTVVPPGWLDKLEEPFKLFLTAALSGPDGGGCHILNNFHGTQGPFEYLEGSCLCCKVSVISQFGLFPQELSGAYGEDSCLSLRVRERGYSIHRVKLPVSHVRGVTSATVPQAKIWQENNHKWLRKRFSHYLRVRTFDHPIVVQRADAWGDVLLVTPIIRAIKKFRPLSSIFVETNCPDVFRDNPNVAEARRGLRFPPNSLHIDLNMSYESMTDIHIVDAYAKKTLDALGGDFEVIDRRLDFYLRPQDCTRAFIPGAKVAVVHAGPVNWRSKEWGLDKFHKLNRDLMDAGWKIILVGNVRAAPIACSEDLRGQTPSIHQLAGIIASANLFIGLDSFPLHLAQAVGTTSIGIFGITSARFILTAINSIGVESDAPSSGLRHRTLNSREVDDAGIAMGTITPQMVFDSVQLAE